MNQLRRTTVVQHSDVRRLGEEQPAFDDDAERRRIVARIMSGRTGRPSGASAKEAPAPETETGTPPKSFAASAHASGRSGIPSRA